MEPDVEYMRGITRRHFLRAGGLSLGAIALGQFAGRDAVADVRSPHFAPKAKRVIYLHMAGSPPQQDLFDFKPKLNELDGQPCPDSLLEGKRFAFIKGHPTILGSPHRFEQYGESGAWVSNMLPHFSGIVDDVTLAKSVYTDEFNHAPAQLFLYTGSPRLGRPSMGSWATYGLGSENEDLPGFIVLVSGGNNPSAGKGVWGSGFLPTMYQGVQCRTSGDPVLYASDPNGMSRETRRRSLDAINAINAMHAERDGDPETLTRIAQYELAFRMQVSVPEVMDISKESPAMLERYGAVPGAQSFANNCLLARRLVESGVRFVQLFDWGWDMHGTGTDTDLLEGLPKKCGETDRPMTALVKDLDERGLLDETLVIWSGEFGRTAMNEGRDGSTYLGRDHHPDCFTVWMAGGGVKRGAVVGETDELSYAVVDTPIHVHDLQATIMHLLGFDHEQLTYRFQGRDFRLTDVHGEVVHALLA